MMNRGDMPSGTKMKEDRTESESCFDCVFDLTADAPPYLGRGKNRLAPAIVLKGVIVDSDGHS